MLCPGVFQFLSLVRNFERAGIALNGPLQRMLNEYENQDDKLKHLHLMRNSDFKSWWPVVEWSSIWRRFESVNVKMFLLENISGVNYTNYPEPLTIVRDVFLLLLLLLLSGYSLNSDSLTYFNHLFHFQYLDTRIVRGQRSPNRSAKDNRKFDRHSDLR